MVEAFNFCRVKISKIPKIKFENQKLKSKFSTLQNFNTLTRGE